MASKTDVINAVLEAASTNSVLLNTISATSEAPSTFRGHIVHLTRLEASLAEQDSMLAALKTAVESLSKSHRKLRDSKFRRFYHRATRMLENFEKRASAEEEKYFAALANRSRAEERQREITTELAAAVEAKTWLEQAAQEHEQAHAQIDALYEKLFAGPTPGFGQEDQKENAFYAAREKNEAIRTKILAARQAIRFIDYANKYLVRAESLVDAAERDVEEALFFFADAQWLLSSGITYTKSALTAVERAGKALGELTPEMRTVEAAVLQKLVDAERGANGAQQDPTVISIITSTKARVSEAKRDLGRFRKLVKGREQAGLEEVKKTARTLEDWRQALYQVRMRIFEEVAGFGEAAPAYTECCDRASGYCVVPEAPHEPDLEMPEPEELERPPPQCENTPQQPPPEYGTPRLPLITTTVELPPPRPQPASQLLSQSEKPPVPNGPESLDE